MNTNFPAWMALSESTRRVLVEEIDRAVVEHDARTMSNDAAVLFGNLGRRSLVKDLYGWVLDTKPATDAPEGYKRIEE